MPETEKIRFSKCRVVRLKDFRSITEKCYKAVMPDNSEILIPASQFFGYARTGGRFEFTVEDENKALKAIFG